MERKIIDVSVHNGNIDWDKVKGQIDGAIIRCGYGSDYENQDDKQFKRNADACTRLGIPFGVYLYSYAKSTAQARSEAQHVLRLIKGYKLTYPVYYDLEEPGTETGCIDRAKIFGDIIEGAGYWCGIYANEYWFRAHIGAALDRFTKWAAKYSSSKPNIPGSKYDIWQYTSKGSIAGIRGAVDVNVAYRDLPAEITGKASITAAATAAAQAVYYTVKAGDTLSAIARAQHTTVAEIANLNGIKDVNKIYAGQTLRVK